MGFRSRVFAVVGLLLAFVAPGATAEQGADGGRNETPMPQRTIEDARNLTDRLMSIPGVLGTAEGLCEGKGCIKVFLAKKTPELLRQIPATVEGYPVAIEETEEFRALDR